MAERYKTKQYLFAFAKVSIVAITFCYIFYRLQNIPQFDFEVFVKESFYKGTNGFFYLLILLLLTTLNWTFEILKWKKLVSTIEDIDFKTALKQSMASLTVSLATPNRIGEYGAKALFFAKEKRKKILILNLFSNTAQLGATALFGMFGLIYFLRNYEVTFSYEALSIFGFVVLCISVLFLITRKKEFLIKGFSVANIVRFFRNLPTSVKISVFGLSLFRYIIFSSMFYALLIFFGAQIELTEAFSLIFAMYFLVSILPTIFIFDVVVRGGVAVWLFSMAGISELTVLSTVMIMWIFNFVLPSIIGSYFVLVYQPLTR